MRTHDIELQFCQDVSGDNGAMIKIEFNDVVIEDNLEIISTDMTTPDVVSFNVEIPDEAAVNTISITYLNDEYIDVDNDRNVKWCGTDIDTSSIRWNTIVFDGYTHTSTATSIDDCGWWPFILTHEGTAVLEITLPYDNNTNDLGVAMEYREAEV